MSRSKIFDKVEDAIRKYKLFTKKSKVGVAVSGGKDSTVLLYILHKLGYDITALTVDAVIGNYTKKNLENIRKLCKKYNITLEEISFKQEFGHSLCFLKSVLKSKGHDYSSCTVCGVLRRHLLNKKARQLKLDCIATGHNMDDEAQTVLMNLFRNDMKLFMRQGPVAGIGKNKNFVARVKPLYFVEEKEIKTFSKKMNFPVVYEPCPCAVDAYRREYREFIDSVEKYDQNIKLNIINFMLGKNKKHKTQKNIKIPSCEECGEPTSRTICKKCEIIKALRDDNGNIKR